MRTRLPVICLFLVAFLSGCAATSSGDGGSAPPGRELKFVDLPNFDRDLAASLRAPHETVEVAFYERVSPNHMPERLQKWLSSVERNGGKIGVEPPPSDLVPRSPIALLGLLGTLLSSAKAIDQFSADRLLDATRGRDARIVLLRNSAGEVVVARIDFRRQSK